MEAPKKIFSVLEQHCNGWWWYHPGWSFDSKQKAIEDIERRMSDDFWRDREFILIEHSTPFPQASKCTMDYVHYHYAGGDQFQLKESIIIQRF